MGQSTISSARGNTCRLTQNSDTMAYLKLILSLCLIGSSFSARKLANNRQQKSLLNTFPFNANAESEARAAPARVAATPNLVARGDRQGNDGADVSFGAVAAAGPGADGKRCIDKVEMVEETEYDEVVQCDHSYDRRCHTTYVTNYESRQEVHDVEDDVVECTTEVEEKCEDETSGYTTNTKCSKWPREVCSVSKKQVKKYTPITGCTKEPRELCAPAGCGFKEGAEECYDKTQTVVQDAPKEECSLGPQRTCAHVTKLVPKLEPTEECVDVPKEVCTRSRTNPRKVKKPVVKKWCYIPTEESGLA